MKTNKNVWDWRSYIINLGPDNSTYKHVLLTLSCFMDSAGGSCFPSIKKLSESASLGKNTVIKYLNKAHEDGWIKKGVHGFSGQGWKRNEYTATLPQNVVQEVNHVKKGGSPDEKGGSPDGGKVVHEVNTISPSNSPSNSPESAREESSDSTKNPPSPETSQKEQPATTGKSPKKEENDGALAGQNIIQKVRAAESTNLLLEMYRTYRKKMGVWDNIYTQEAQQLKFQELGLERGRKALENTIRNGWKKLVEPDEEREKEAAKEVFDPTGIANAGMYTEYEAQ